MDSKTIIEMQEITVWYDGAQAVTKVSMQLERNTVIALIGPSGCGKSTLLRCINRMNDLIPGARVEGKLYYQGKNIYAPEVNPMEIRFKIGMVFQKPTPFPKSIYENIAFGPRINGFQGDLRELVQHALERAALWDEVKDRLHQSAYALSGGQQQRLCIARALAMEPEILLMDEPCSALDPASTAKIEETIAQLKKAYTIVLVTHNLQQAARVSDFTAFFLHGEMVEFDETSIIFTAPREQRTEDYVTGRFG